MVSHRTLSLVPCCFFLYIDISTDTDSEIRLFADDYVCYPDSKDTEDTLKLLKYRSTGVMGKEIGYEISTCQMQYDANN